MSSSEIELSVCIPNYERLDWLRAGLARWLTELRPFGDAVELVVTDDGSVHDPTSEIPSEVRYFRHAHRVGAMGNFASVVRLARGKFVWMVGNDDLPIAGAIERILSVVRAHPEVEHIYVNYAIWTSSAPPEDDVVVAAADYMSGHSDTTDRPIARVDAVLKGDINMYTNIYASVWRREHAVAAFDPKFAEQPFCSSLVTCVPQAAYIAQNLAGLPGYFVGKPCLLSSYETHWTSRYGSIYFLRFLPELLDLYVANGTDPAVVCGHRRELLKHARAAIRGILCQPRQFQWHLLDVSAFVRRNITDCYFWALPALIFYDAFCAFVRRLKR